MVIVSVAGTYIFRLAANIESRVLLFMFAAFDHYFELASCTSDARPSKTITLQTRHGSKAFPYLRSGEVKCSALSWSPTPWTRAPRRRSERPMQEPVPTTSEKKCPRPGCGSTDVEQVGGGADATFGNAKTDAPIERRWVCQN